MPCTLCLSLCCCQGAGCVHPSLLLSRAPFNLLRILAFCVSQIDSMRLRARLLACALTCAPTGPERFLRHPRARQHRPGDSGESTAQPAAAVSQHTLVSCFTRVWQGCCLQRLANSCTLWEQLVLIVSVLHVRAHTHHLAHAGVVGVCITRVCDPASHVTVLLPATAAASGWQCSCGRWQV
jgi:hypothetical protein